MLARLLIVTTLTATAAGGARADWINLTGAETARNIAEITVEDDGVRIAVEIFPGDIDQFGDITLDGAPGDDPAGTPPGASPLPPRADRSFRVETSEGVGLPVEVQLVEPRLRKDRASRFAGMINPQTGTRVPGPPEDKRVVYAELFYPFDGRPDALTISPPGIDAGETPPTIGFIAYHKTIPIIDFRYLSASATLELDWNDPWYSRFDNPNLKRHHKDALMGFLYIEPRAIRLEALMRVRDLEKWTDLGLADLETIEIGKQADVLQKAASFFETANSVTAEDVGLDLAGSRASFVEIGTAGLNVVDGSRDLDRSAALIGVVSEYNTDALPQKVALDWQLFDGRQETVPVTIFDPAGPFMSYATPEERLVVWQNFLRKYVEPSADPVPTTGSPVLMVPVASAGLILVALICLVVWAWTRFRLRLAGWATLICLVGAVATLPFARIAVSNPFAGTPSQSALAETLTRLVSNLYVALDEHDPERRQAALATSATDGRGDMIEAEAQSGLIVGLAGGSQARRYELTDMTLRNIQPAAEPGNIAAVANWTARVSGGHWGHVHVRDVAFEAQIELAPETGDWKLAALTVTKRQ
ncbi:MAG: hypothetical protein GY798_23870 [Hyphomicrobiales bacterium]|nr:hypothetical protein [Hyphomicrobiales bacterium]